MVKCPTPTANFTCCLKDSELYLTNVKYLFPQVFNTNAKYKDYDHELTLNGDCCFSEATKRRTRTVTGSCSPAWNQSFAYMEIGRADIQNRSLEITVFDYDRIGSGEYMGEVGITIIYLRVKMFFVCTYDLLLEDKLLNACKRIC